MTNDQLNDALRTLLDRIEVLETREDKSDTRNRLMCERLDNHAEQIALVNGKVNDIKMALITSLRMPNE